MRFMSRTFHLACALLLATAATPLHAAKADRILIVVSGEGRDQGKTRPGYEFDELSQAWLLFRDNGLEVEVASPQGGPVEPDKYNPDEPFNAQLLADAAAMAQLKTLRLPPAAGTRSGHQPAPSAPPFPASGSSCSMIC